MSSPVLTFADLVHAELARARLMFPPLERHLDAAGVICEERDEFSDEVKKHQGDRDPRLLFKELIQVAAMAQRAVEDLQLIVPQPDPQAPHLTPVALMRRTWLQAIEDELPRLRRCLIKPLKLSHGAWRWLDYSVRRYDDAVEMGQGPHDTFMLTLLVDIYARCYVIAADLHLRERCEARRVAEAAGVPVASDPRVGRPVASGLSTGRPAAPATIPAADLVEDLEPAAPVASCASPDVPAVYKHWNIRCPRCGSTKTTPARATPHNAVCLTCQGPFAVRDGLAMVDAAHLEPAAQ